MSFDRESLGPPDREAINKEARFKRQVSQVAPPMVVLADPHSSPRRRVSVLNVLPPEATGHRLSIVPPVASLPVLSPNGQIRRPSFVTQPNNVQVPGKARRTSAAINKQLLMSIPIEKDEAKVPPLAEAIFRPSSTGKEQSGALVLVETEKNSILTPSSSYSSLKSHSSSKLTISSMEVNSHDLADSPPGTFPGGWRQRWSIEKVGRQAGEIKCIKDVCVLRSGNIVVTESKNVRLQVFSKTGKSLAVLGPESESNRTMKSFGNPLSFRKMQPKGLVETVVDNLVAVTDLNRILYVQGFFDGQLEAEVILKGKVDLHGIASTQNSKLIISEVGSQASVGIYDTSGKPIREFKGDFRKPSYLSWNSDYNLCAVSDSEQQTVFLYDATGNNLTKFKAIQRTQCIPSPSSSSAPGQLVYPAGVSWISQGRLLVADQARNEVLLFDLRNLTAETVLSVEHNLNQPVAIAGDFGDSKCWILLAEEYYDFGVNKYYLKLLERRR